MCEFGDSQSGAAVVGATEDTNLFRCYAVSVRKY
jgi:hypothetical protein